MARFHPLVRMAISRRARAAAMQRAVKIVDAVSSPGILLLSGPRRLGRPWRIAHGVRPAQKLAGLRVHGRNHRIDGYVWVDATELTIR